MATDTADLITRFSRVYLENRPAEGTVSTLAARVDDQAATLSQLLLEFHQSGDRAQGNADELAKLFFIMFNRPPDYATFAYAMDLLEAGNSLAKLAELAMTVRGGQLNSIQSNQEFVNKLASQMFVDANLVPGLNSLLSVLVAQLTSGAITRGELLAAAAGYDHSQLKYRADIDTSLLVMAAAGREASRAELTQFRGDDPLPVIRELLLGAGELPFGELPFFSVGVTTNGDPSLTVSGSIVGSLDINLLAKTSVLTDSDPISNYKLIYSPDGGISESIIRFRSSLLSNFETLDVSAIATEDLTNIVVTAHNNGLEFKGADATNIVYAGAGDDTLVGGVAADTFYASAGIDTFTGNSGADVFSFAPAATYRANTRTTTSIEDFGNGADKLSLSRLFGKTTAAANVTPIQVDAQLVGVPALAALVANGVVLVNNSGAWVDGSGNLVRATTSNIAALFNGVTITDATTNSKFYSAITYDISNGADVWLISNFTGLTAVVEAEIQLIGHIDNYATTDLLTQLKTAGAIVA